MQLNRFTVCVRGEGSCVITQTNRTHCKLCRYNKCIQVGMVPAKVDATLAKRREKDARRIVGDKQSEHDDRDNFLTQRISAFLLIKFSKLLLKKYLSLLQTMLTPQS